MAGLYFVNCLFASKFDPVVALNSEPWKANKHTENTRVVLLRTVSLLNTNSYENGNSYENEPIDHANQQINHSPTICYENTV